MPCGQGTQQSFELPLESNGIFVRASGQSTDVEIGDCDIWREILDYPLHLLETGVPGRGDERMTKRNPSGCTSQLCLE